MLGITARQFMHLLPAIATFDLKEKSLSTSHLVEVSLKVAFGYIVLQAIDIVELTTHMIV